jgi:alanine dehydrogenase
MGKRVIAIAYETVEMPNGTLPLLAAMSEIAGRMAVQVGMGCLEKPRSGRGVLL